MENTQQIIMSLRNILLQPAAIYFKEIFLDTDQESGKFTFKQGIRLPPCLFEDILRNGKEIGWPISPLYILPCIPFRTKLNWEDVDLSNEFYKYENIIEITNSTIPIRSLSINTNNFDLGAMAAIERFAPTLESLEIFSECGYLRYVLEKSDFKRIKFPKLKKLRIESDLSIIEFFNLKSCSESLELLFLNRHEYFLNPNEHSFAGDLKNLKQLKYLFLVKRNKRTVPELIDSIQQLQSLKHLQIGTIDCYHYSPITSEYMIDLINSLPNLERLAVVPDITYEAISWLENYFKASGRRTLKYLGASLSYRDEDKYERLSKILNVGAKITLESTLARYENSYFDSGIDFETLYEPIESTTSDFRKLENIIFGELIDEKEYRVDGAVRFLDEVEEELDWRLVQRRGISMRDVDEFKWSQDFKRKIAMLSLKWFSQHEKPNIRDIKDKSFAMISSEQMQDFIFTYILTNPKNIISRLFLRQSISKLLLYDTMNQKMKENEDVYNNFEVLDMKITNITKDL